MQHKFIKKTISFVLTVMMCFGIASDIPMTVSAAAAAKTIWVEVKSKASKTPTQKENAILEAKGYKIGYHLEYVGNNKKCEHTSADGSAGRMYFKLSADDRGYVSDDASSRTFPRTNISFSKATVTQKFLEDRLTVTGSLKKHDANITLDFSNFIMGTDGTNVYGTSKPKGLGYGKVSTIRAVFTGNKAKGIKSLRGAYQYIDQDYPTGGAAYAYFSQTYSYCAATDHFYYISEKVTHMHCCMNPDGTVGVPYVWPEGKVTYGHANNEDSFDEPYEHYIAQFNIVPNTYTLTVKPNGGSWNSKTTDQAFTLSYKGTKTIANPTRTGYSFAGWTLSGSGSSLSGTTFTMGSANATLTAKWTKNSYTLTVKPNGGSWNSKTTDQAFTLSYKGTKTIANPTRTGYSFGGWTLSGSGSSLSGTTFTMGSANATLTAKWTADVPEKPGQYTILFDGNGATEGEMEELTAEVHASVRLPENGYKRMTEQGESQFMGWTRIPESHTPEFANQETIAAGLTQTADDTVILYAVWDDCPLIDACDRYFTLKQAQDGAVTQEELLRKVVAVDREDNILENGTNVIVLAYQESDFTSFTADGSVSVTYQATDMAGNQTCETVTVYIVDAALKDDSEKWYVRFISPKFYRDGAEYVPEEKGGLKENSIWKEMEEYRELLDFSMENSKSGEETVEAELLGKREQFIRPGSGVWEHKTETWEFNPEQVQAVKQLVRENGFGSYEKENGIELFYQQFDSRRER